MIERSEAIRVAPELGPVLETLGTSWPYIVRWVYRFQGDKGLVYIVCFSGSATRPMYTVMTANVEVVDGALLVSNLGTYKCAESLEELLAICPSEWSDIILPDAICTFCGDFTCGVEYDCEATMRFREAQHRPPSGLIGERGPVRMSVPVEDGHTLGLREESSCFTEDFDRLDVGRQILLDRQATQQVLEALKTGRSVFEIGENLDD